MDVVGGCGVRRKCAIGVEDDIINMQQSHVRPEAHSGLQDEVGSKVKVVQRQQLSGNSQGFSDKE